MTTPDRANEVLDFWLPADLDAPAQVAAASKRWFARDDALDADIRTRYASLVEAARDGACDAWADAPRSWIALLILLDQFPRNLYRGSALAFATDAKAQGLAQRGIAQGYDRALHPLECLFAYLPFEHAEDRALQDRSVELFAKLKSRVVPAQSETFYAFAGYAAKHREVIVRFGRFPHRNKVLGRVDTAEETAYLDQPGSGF